MKNLTIRIKKGSITIISFILIFAIIVIINLLISELPATLTKIDMSSTKMYSISKKTISVLESLNEDIFVYLIAPSGSEDMGIVEMMNRYKDVTDRVRFKIVDPILQPAFITRYTSNELSTNSVIVAGEKQSVVLDYFDIYIFDYTEFAQFGKADDDIRFDVYFDGEAKITNAIYAVANNAPSIMYALNGHGELILSQGIQDFVSDEYISILPLNMLVDFSVPDNASCVFIYRPAKDISDDEKKAITEYMRKGGKVLLITDYTNCSMTNLMSLASDYGFSPVDGVIVEGSSDYCVSQYPYYLLPEMMLHDILKPQIGASVHVLFPAAHGIRKDDSVRNDLYTFGLLYTSGLSYAKEDWENMITLVQETNDTLGPFIVGGVATESVKEGETRFVWFSSSQFITDEVDTVVSGSNSDLFLNTVNWLCHRDNVISIRNKPVYYNALIMPASHSTFWSILFIIIIPLIVMIVGAAILVRRKNR